MEIEIEIALAHQVTSAVAIAIDKMRHAYSSLSLYEL